MVGLPLAGLEEGVLVAAAAQHSSVYGPALAVCARELVPDVGVAYDDELTAPASFGARTRREAEQCEDCVVVDGVAPEAMRRRLGTHHVGERRVEP